MASSQNPDKMLANLAVTHYDFDPDDADPNDVAWVDMRDFSNFMCSFFRTVGTGALDTFAIIANSASDGSGTDVTVRSHAVSSEPNATGDYIFLEISGDEIADIESENGVAILGLSASCEFATGTDEGVVTYVIRGRQYADATADTVS